MSNDDIISRHSKERFTLTIQRKKDWGELLKKQKEDALTGKQPENLAERFAKEQDAFNKQRDKQMAELLKRQQEELEELSKTKGQDKTKDRERD